MDHRRDVELDHLLVDRIPEAVGERRVGPEAAGRVRVEVAADEAELVHAALELVAAVRRRDARRLRQLADADEVLRVELRQAVDGVVAEDRPLAAGVGGADVVGHAAGPRREDRDVRAALALELELRALDALAELVVRDLQGRPRRRLRRVLQGVDLALAPVEKLLRLGRVVAVTVDDDTARSTAARGGLGRSGRRLPRRRLRLGRGRSKRRRPRHHGGGQEAAPGHAAWTVGEGGSSGGCRHGWLRGEAATAQA